VGRCCCWAGAAGLRPKGGGGNAEARAGREWGSNWSRPRSREGKEKPFSFRKTTFLNYFTKLISKPLFEFLI